MILKNIFATPLTKINDLELKVYHINQEIKKIDDKLSTMRIRLSETKYEIEIDIPIKDLITYYNKLPKKLRHACRLRNTDELDLETIEDYHFETTTDKFRLIIDYDFIKLNFNIHYIMNTLLEYSKLKDKIKQDESKLHLLYTERGNVLRQINNLR